MLCSLRSPPSRDFCFRASGRLADTALDDCRFKRLENHYGKFAAPSKTSFLSAHKSVFDTLSFDVRVILTKIPPRILSKCNYLCALGGNFL